MKLQTKKLIAREGLILVSIILVAFAMFHIGAYNTALFNKKEVYIKNILTFFPSLPQQKYPILRFGLTIELMDKKDANKFFSEYSSAMVRGSYINITQDQRKTLDFLSPGEIGAIDILLGIRREFNEYADLTGMEIAEGVSKNRAEFPAMHRNLKSAKIKLQYAFLKYNRLKDNYEVMRKNGKKLLIFGYPLYLLIIFIIWSLKTLKAKEKNNG